MANIEKLLEERGKLLAEMSKLSPEDESYMRYLVAVQEISKTIVNEENLNLENDRQLIKLENEKALGQEANKINEKNGFWSNVIAGATAAGGILTVLAATYASETRVITNAILGIGRDLFKPKKK